MMQKADQTLYEIQKNLIILYKNMKIFFAFKNSRINIVLLLDFSF